MGKNRTNVVARIDRWVSYARANGYQLTCILLHPDDKLDPAIIKYREEIEEEFGLPIKFITEVL